MSGRKRSRSPMPRRDVRRRLERALRQRRLVRIGRWIPKGDPVDGVVVALGAGWVILARLGWTVNLDGWVALRLADIHGISTLAAGADFEIEAFRLREQWPPRIPAATRCDDVTGVLATAARNAPLIAVYDEFARPDACWIGVPGKVGKRRLRLLEIDPGARWKSRPTRFELDDITRIEFGAGYEEALHLVGGDPPGAGTGE